MDTTQLLLMIVLTLTSVLLVIVGVQLFFVLKELHRTLNRVNTIIDSFESLGVGLDHGLTEVVGFVNGIKTIFTALDHITHRKNDKNK